MTRPRTLMLCSVSVWVLPPAGVLLALSGGVSQSVVLSCRAAAVPVVALRRQVVCPTQSASSHPPPPPSRSSLTTPQPPNISITHHTTRMANTVLITDAEPEPDIRSCIDGSNSDQQPQHDGGARERATAATSAAPPAPIITGPTADDLLNKLPSPADSAPPKHVNHAYGDDWAEPTYWGSFKVSCAAWCGALRATC